MLASSIGLRKTKAARCKPSYATTGAENQNARMNPEDKKNVVATQPQGRAIGIRKVRDSSYSRLCKTEHNMLTPNVKVATSATKRPGHETWRDLNYP